MKKSGFIFSLDSFVAFTILILSVSFFIFIINIPNNYFLVLQQANQLAFDTLKIMATTSENSDSPTYLQEAFSAYSTNDQAKMRNILFKVAGGNGKGLIPKGYGYAIQFYDLSTGRLDTFYDAGQDILSDRYGIKYTKFKVSASTFISTYSIKPSPGESPFCYLSCKGFDQATGRKDDSVCTATPCDSPISLFNPGENKLYLVRFIVYS
jgi:hypothetical protein